MKKILRNFKLLYRWYLFIDNAKLEIEQRRLKKKLAEQEAILNFKSLQNLIANDIDNPSEYIQEHIENINHITCKKIAEYIDVYILEDIPLKDIKEERRATIAKAINQIIHRGEK